MDLKDLKVIETLEEERKTRGLSKSKFAKEKHVSKGSYYYSTIKLEKIKEKDKLLSGDFIPIEVFSKDKIEHAPCSSEIEIEMRTSKGSELRLHGSLTKEMLEVLLKA